MDVLKDIPMAPDWNPMAWKHVQAVLTVKLPHPEKCLLMVLATFANAKTSEARPGLNTLRASAGFADRKSTLRILERLIGKGFINKVPSNGRTNVYLVNDPEECTGEVVDMCLEATCPEATPSGPGPHEILKGTKGHKPKATKGSSKALKEAAEKIYAEYPRKVGKQAAITKLIPLIQERGEDFLLERVKTFAEAWKQRVEIEGEKSRRFIPYMSSWLNQGRFDDDSAEWFPAKRKKIDHGKPW